jgi:arylformamidase
MKLIDISPLLSARTAVWPGDVRFTREVSSDTGRGDHITLSSIAATVHLGAHADAPSHYRAGGDDIATRALQRYYGPCQVVPVTVPRGERIRPGHLRCAITAPRLLLRSDSFPDPESWNSDFNALSAELIEFLHARGVELVGIDTPSVDLQEDKLLESHQAIADHDMAILEGLVLAHVEPGEYLLCALPLRIEGADASPVRAVLVSGR